MEPQRRPEPQRRRLKDNSVAGNEPVAVVQAVVVRVVVVQAVVVQVIVVQVIVVQVVVVQVVVVRAVVARKSRAFVGEFVDSKLRR